MDRRTFVVSSAAAFAGTFCAPVRRCLATVTDSAINVDAIALFGPEQHQLVGALVERIIPKTDTPGALEAGVPDFIEFMLAEGFVREDRDMFMSGLDEVERLSRSEHGGLYIELTSLQQDVILARLEQASEATQPQSEPSFFQVLKELTLVGYYTSEIGARQELRYVPIPGRYDPCVDLGDNDRAFFYSTPLDTML